jgi:drug/metabolite transporter (DMT)-like permease
MRVLAPVFGAVGTAALRLLIAGVFLMMVFKVSNYKILWKRDWKILFIIGVINSAIPFSSFAFAALYIPASISVVINSMTPMFGSLFAALILGEKLTMQKGMGLVLGTTGVIIISGSKALPVTMEAYLAIAACVLATICYGLAGALIKKYANKIETKALAGGSQIFAGLSLLPILLVTGVSQPVTVNVGMLMIVFAILCSAIAYLIYFHLIKEMGPTSALSVTFLMPVFGILWGKLILNEVIYSQMLVGAVVILMGTYLVVRKPKSIVEI